MSKEIPILHVDGSLSEYIDDKNELKQYGGIGAYLVKDGKIIDQFHKCLHEQPFIERHEDYAILEGLKWTHSKGFKQIQIKTDSMSSLHLFSHNKRRMDKTDKFFLIQFMLLDAQFEYIDISYHSRTDKDLAHTLSRQYLKNIPENLNKLHSEHNKKKKDLFIIEKEPFKNAEIQNILFNNAQNILHTRRWI